MVTKHDYFCRCRTCKPPLVGEDRSRNILSATILLVAWAAFLFGAWMNWL